MFNILWNRWITCRYQHLLVPAFQPPWDFCTAQFKKEGPCWSPHNGYPSFTNYAVVLTLFKTHLIPPLNFFRGVWAKFQIPPLRRMMFALKLFCFHSISVSCVLSFSPFSSDIHILLFQIPSQNFAWIPITSIISFDDKTPQRCADIEKLRQRSN